MNAKYSQHPATQMGGVTVQLQWTAGTSGAVPAAPQFKHDAQPISALTKLGGTGIYKFAMREPAVDLLGWNIRTLQASYSASGAVYGDVTTIDVANGAGASFQVTFRTAAGAAVDLATGDKVFMALEFLTLSGV